MNPRIYPLLASLVAFGLLLSCKEAQKAAPRHSTPSQLKAPSKRAKKRRFAPPRPRIKWGKPEKLSQLHVRFFAAGHGDSILLRTPKGHNILIDLGRGAKEELGDNLVKRRLLPFMIKRGIRWLDAFFITHPHWDHFGDPITFGRIVRFDKILTNADVAYLLPGWFPLPSSMFQALTRGWKKRFGKLLLEVLHPPAGGPHPEKVDGVARHNNRSIVLRATYGKIKFLLTGDLMYRGEWQMLRARLPGRAHVLKLGHHGLGSTSSMWLRQIRPRYAVATCGDKWRKRYDYLSRKLYQRLAKYRVRLFRSDRHGDIVFRTDGKKLTVKYYKELIHIPEWKKKRRRKRRPKTRRPKNAPKRPLRRRPTPR